MTVNDFADRQILVVGDVMLDQFVRGEVSRVSPEAPALVLRIVEEHHQLGGAGNLAANLTELGARAVLVGLIGNDAATHRLGTVCAGNPRLDCQFVTHRDWPTITKTRFIASGSHLLRTDRETSEVPDGVDGRIIAAIEDVAPTCAGLVICDRGKGLVTPGVIAAMVAAARAHAIPLVVAAGRPDLAAYRGATVLTLGHGALARATGMPADGDAQVAAAMPRALAAFGGPVALVRPDQGVSLFRPGEAPVHEPPRCRAVRNVCGVGDTVAAALVLALAAGAGLPEGVRVANAAAGIALAKSGTAPASARELADALRVDAGACGCGTKIVTRALAGAICREWAAEDLTVGFTHGSFDIVHPGHVRLLRAARARCDRLVVALATDAAIGRLKGPARPIQPEGARADVIAALQVVDLVVLLDEDTPLSLIAALRPDVLFKGADHTFEEVTGGEMVSAYGGRVELIDLVPGQSTSHIVTRSRERAAG